MPALRLGAGHRADPLAAEGAAPRARAGARTSPRRCSRALRPRSEPLLEALARALEAQRGVRIRRDGVGPVDGCRRTCGCASASRTTPARSLAEGEDLDALRERSQPRLRAAAGGARPRARAHRRCATWTSASCRESSRCRARGRRSAPTRRWSTRARRSASRCSRRRRAGARDARRHAPAAAADGPARRCAWVEDRLGNAAKLALLTAPHGSVGAVLEDALDGGARRAGRRGRRPGVGRGRRSSGCAPTSPARSPTRTAAVVAPGRGGARRGRARSSARLEALPARPAAAEPAATSPPARAARAPRLRHRDRRAPAGRRRALPARRRRRLDRLPDAADIDRDRMRTSTSSRRAYAAARRLARRHAEAGRALRGAVDARGAARRAVRARASARA